VATDRTAIDDALHAAGARVSADFVPFSKSRNAKPQPKLAELSINWRITITRNGRAFTTDYQAGIGHLPGYSYRSRHTIDEAEAIRSACETGKAYKPGNRWHAQPLPLPDVADVLHCLLCDAEAVDAGTFEEWCGNVGADTDSRKDEAIYRACLDTGLKLRSLLGDALIAELRQLLADH
jgi:hypothetical protein